MLCYVNLQEKMSQCATPTLMVDENPLTLVSSVKYLGIQINLDLSWSPHVANLCIKAHCTFFPLRSHKPKRHVGLGCGLWLLAYRRASLESTQLYPKNEEVFT